MAAEMPVKDVLCEAMDYLSKLGSNLRTRSENLKEKKIRRDKLTNSLAVQKAADKVLLICELSKKSLSNVEAGVRKILEHIDFSQASSNVGGKSSNNKTASKKRDATSKYYYFDYKSRKLKIKHNISLKHYRSVKVLARKMSISMISKYPVYHDCKLFRKRKKERNSQEQDSIEKHYPKTSLGDDDKKSDNSSNNSKTEKLKSQLEKKTTSKADSEDDNVNFGNQIEHSSGIDNVKDNNPELSKNAGRQRKNSREGRKYARTKSSPTKKTTKKCDSDDISDNADSDKNKIEQSVNNSDEETNKLSEEPASKKSRISTTDSEQKNNVCVEPDTEKNNPSDDEIGVNDTYNDENSSENESVKPMIKCVSLSKLLKLDILQNDTAKSSKLQPETNLSNIAKKNAFNVLKKNEMLLLAKKNKDDFRAQKREEVKAFKSKQFVININRLPKLSTDFLTKNNLISVTRAGSTVCEITSDANSSNKKEPETTVDMIKISLLNSDSDEDEDIPSEPKNKSIVKLIDNGSDKNCDSDSSIDNTESRTINDENKLDSHDTACDAEAARNNLLQKSDTDSKSDRYDDKQNNAVNDHDSQESCDKSKGKNDDKQNNAVNDHDSQESCDKSDGKNDQEQNNTGNEHDSRETSSEQKSLEKNAAGIKDDNAKKSLLDDSSDDLNVTPLNQRKTKHQSKNKCIRESVQAKNALLRYSSGSETEDDQLRNVLTDIKKSLLEGMSDDENQLNINKHEEERSLQSSSPDVILQISKQKKCGKADNRFSDDENSTSSSRQVRPNK